MLGFDDVIEDGLGIAGLAVGELELGEVFERFFVGGLVDLFGEVPALVREVGTIEDGEGGFETNGGVDGGIVEEAVDGVDGFGGEVADAVAESSDVFRLGVFDGGGEGGALLEPGVDGGAADTRGFGRMGKGGSRGEGEGDLSLGGAETGAESVFHAAQKVAWRVGDVAWVRA
jgi:hypothetical protein